MSKSLSSTIKLSILLKSGLATTGWIIFGFGMFINWFIINNTDLSFYHFSGPVETVTGTVIQCGATSVSSGGNEDTDGTPVTETYYSFIAKDGLEYKDISYRTGAYNTKGNKVSVEYPKGKPYFARMRGYDREVFGVYALLFLLIPSLGLCLIIVGTSKGGKTLKLLSNGYGTEASFSNKVSTGTVINDNHVYKLNYEFIADDEKIHTCTIKTHRIVGLTSKKKNYQIVYDPNNPDSCFLLDSLPGNIRFNKKGEVVGTSTSIMGALSIPLLCGIPHLIYAVNRIITNL